MEQLQIPQYDCQVKKIEGELYIFDPIRRKNLLLTPEEWVRQHFVRYLLEEFDYPRGLMRTEGGLRYEQRQKRSDILVYDRNTEPFLLVECKASHIALSQETIEQASQYNYVIKAKYFAITNGLDFIIFKWTEAKGAYIAWQGIPEFERA